VEFHTSYIIMFPIIPIGEIWGDEILREQVIKKA
jgi:hypothetical protein